VLGIDRFSSDINEMIGVYPGLYWRVCWKFVAPIFILVSPLMVIIIKVDNKQWSFRLILPTVHNRIRSAGSRNRAVDHPRLRLPEVGECARLEHHVFIDRVDSGHGALQDRGHEGLLLPATEDPDDALEGHPASHHQHFPQRSPRCPQCQCECHEGQVLQYELDWGTRIRKVGVAVRELGEEAVNIYIYIEQPLYNYI
jgi:hypothetical protein